MARHGTITQKIEAASNVLRRKILRRLPAHKQADVLATLVEGFYIEEIDGRNGTRKVYLTEPNVDALKLAMERTAGKVATPVSVSGEVAHIHVMRQIIVPTQHFPARVVQDVTAEIVDSIPPLLLPMEDDEQSVPVGQNDREGLKE